MQTRLKHQMGSILVVLVSSITLAGCTIPLLSQKQAGIQVSIKGGQSASVFLNDENLGSASSQAVQFPNLKPERSRLRLVPSDPSLYPYETEITLAPGVITSVIWSFGPNFETSAGEIFTLEAIGNSSSAELSVVSTPENAIIKLDGQSKGFSPLNISNLTEGSSTALTVTAPGYLERTTSITLKNGHRLTAQVKLAREALPFDPIVDESATSSAALEERTQPSSSPTSGTRSARTIPSPSPSSSPTATPKATPQSSSNSSLAPPYVVINETSTGWLRVRAEASGSSEEVAKVDVGTKLPYLGETISGWHGVEYETGKKGWVSGQFATIVRE